MSESLRDILKNRQALEKQASVAVNNNTQEELTMSGNGFDKIASASAAVYERKLRSNLAKLQSADEEFMKEANGNAEVLNHYRTGFQKLAAEAPEELGLEDVNPTEEEVAAEIEASEAPEGPELDLDPEEAKMIVAAVGEMVAAAVDPSGEASEEEVAQMAEEMFSEMMSQGVPAEVVAGAVVTKAVEAGAIPAEAASVAMDSLAGSFEETQGASVPLEAGVAKEASITYAFADQIKQLIG